jgi:hypothetical protein
VPPAVPFLHGDEAKPETPTAGVWLIWGGSGGSAFVNAAVLRLSTRTLPSVPGLRAAAARLPLAFYLALDEHSSGDEYLPGIQAQTGQAGLAAIARLFATALS